MNVIPRKDKEKEGSKLTTSFRHSQKQAAISIMKCRHKADFSIDSSGQRFSFKLCGDSIKTLKVREFLAWLLLCSS